MSEAIGRADFRSPGKQLGIARATLDAQRRELAIPVQGGAAVLTEALRRLDAAAIRAQDVGLRRPTLDDVFLSLTGHDAEPEVTPREEQAR